jgi:hypothetical protein
MMRSTALAACIAVALVLAACGSDSGIKLSDTAKVKTACLKGANKGSKITASQASTLCDCVTRRVQQSGYKYENDIPKARQNEISQACAQELIRSQLGRPGPGGTRTTP